VRVRDVTVWHQRELGRPRIWTSSIDSDRLSRPSAKVSMSRHARFVITRIG
jgi:hypothetical protein